jgi:hypothetical protein
MKRTILLVTFGWWGCFLSNPVYAQTEDTLSDDDIYEMKSSAERTLQDYASAMRELINPRISKAYRDRMINEFVTPGNRQIFVDSAYIVYDYEPEHLPPLMMKERPVRTYLNDFNAFYQGNDSQERLSVYFSLRRIHDVELEGNSYYIILDFESQYGDQLPQPRRATMQLIPQGDGEWQALISYVKFNLEEEDPFSEAPTAREALVPQWRILAERADTLLQAGELVEAKILLDSSLAVNQEPYNAQLLGQYYQQQGDLEAALFSYEQSIALGVEADSSYQDMETQQRIAQLQDQLLAEQEAEKAREAAAAAPSVTFANMTDTYKQGKEYQVRWSGVIYDPLTLQLYRNDRFVSTLREGVVNSSFTWKVPKTVEKGDNYQFRLIKPGAEAGVKSGEFSIKRRTPLGIYIGASVGVGAALYFLLREPPCEGPDCDGGTVIPPGEEANPIGPPPNPQD